MIQEKDIQVPVRDGVKIGVRIYRPEGGGPFPALFAASPYRYDNNELPPRPMFLWRETGPIEKIGTLILSRCSAAARSLQYAS